MTVLDKLIKEGREFAEKEEEEPLEFMNHAARQYELLLDIITEIGEVLVKVRDFHCDERPLNYEQLLGNRTAIACVALEKVESIAKQITGELWKKNRQ